MKLIQTPQEKDELSQFRRLNGPEALVLTGITPPLFGRSQTRQGGLVNVILNVHSISICLRRLYTQSFIQSALRSIAMSRGTGVSLSSQQHLSDIAGNCPAEGVGGGLGGEPRSGTLRPSNM